VKRHLRKRALIAVLGVPALALLIGPTSVASDRAGVVAVSADAVHWSSSLTTPLFDPEVRWVPGDRRTASFFVRNGGPTPASLRLDVRSTAGDLVHTGDVTFSARTGGGAWVPLARDRDSAVLSVAPLPVGADAQVDVRATFDPASTNRSQHSSAELWFVVRLTDTKAEPVSSGPLPATGAPALAPVILTAAAVIGIGLGLIRRRREADHG
jgi:LPXTG-motif cell wall-anchored protein